MLKKLIHDATELFETARLHAAEPKKHENHDQIEFIDDTLKISGGTRLKTKITRTKTKRNSNQKILFVRDSIIDGNFDTRFSSSIIASVNQVFE